MARTEARMKTTIWSDADFLALSHGAQWMYHLILEQPELSLCGVTAITMGRWASRSVTTTPEDIRAFMEELEKHHYIVIDELTEEVWVRSFIEHDGVLKSANSLIGMTRDYPGICSDIIRKGVMEGLVEGDTKGLLEGVITSTDEGVRKRVPEGFAKGFTHACTRSASASNTSTASASAADVEISSLSHLGVVR